MKKNIWILNHYATEMYKNKGGRHYWFAENLMKQGYHPTIFCANTFHSSMEIIKIKSGKYITDVANEIPFVFIKTPSYLGNGKQRGKNMIVFYSKLFSVAKEYVKFYGEPDIILASSVHPLTMVAGIKIAKKFGVPCICEVRDLWPESFVSYNIIKKNNPIMKLLYAGEKWIYKKADKLVFTMEGGRDYIIEKGWDKAHSGPIDLDKVYHINNGVDLETFKYNKEKYILGDADLSNDGNFKVIYAGSIRKANNVQIIVDAAKKILDRGYDKIKIIVYGDGDRLDNLKQRALDDGINNIIFKGRVDKKYIPFILSKGNMNIMDLCQNELFRFGVSPNKLFDYFASGKPILSIEYNHDLIKRYQCGVTMKDLDVNEVAENIINLYKMDSAHIKQMSENALKAAEVYDFKALTNKLIELL